MTFQILMEVNTGAELVLLIRQSGRSTGFEFKLTRSPRVTLSMRSASEVFELYVEEPKTSQRR